MYDDPACEYLIYASKPRSTDFFGEGTASLAEKACQLDGGDKGGVPTEYRTTLYFSFPSNHVVRESVFNSAIVLELGFLNVDAFTVALFFSDLIQDRVATRI
jgi:hypothetical protein